MIEIAKASDTDKRVLFLNTGNKINLKPYIVEKDFWVCYILDYLFNRSKFKKSFVFKGGTSLSKVYHLISRFSEDIDLILDWNIINHSTEELWEERTNSQQSKLIEKVINETSDFLENKLLPSMIEDIEKELGFIPKIEMDQEDEDKCTINFYYPIVIEGDNVKYIKQRISLEIGPFAEWTPSHKQKISAYSATVYKELFKDNTIMVKAVDAERTFWEKIVILHTVALGYKNGNIPIRYARHYYDVFCIAKSNIKESAFKKVELLERDVKFKTKFYHSKSALYETAYIGNIKLIPNDETIIALKEDYEIMENMFYNEYPSFEEILNCLKKLEQEINKLKK